jgi:ElaA protein
MQRLIVKEFDQLSPFDLYKILQLRTEVFVVEQDCPYQDMDGLDVAATHLWLQSENGELLAYARVMAPETAYEEYCAIGRIVCRKEARGNYLGVRIVQSAIDILKANYAGVPIKISAQCYLEEWYSELGFEKFGPIYLEDNIPHIAMIYRY